MTDLYRETWRKAGHPAEKCFVGVHNIGFVAETTQQALNDFWPGYREMFGRLGRERGWPEPTRSQFDAQCSHIGALMVGGPEALAEKIVNESKSLGGLSRLTVLLDNRLLHARAAHACDRIAGDKSCAAGPPSVRCSLRLI
ncbi:MAG: hypothetical protein QM760_13050 [Nibricoccus sp.]